MWSQQNWSSTVLWWWWTKVFFFFVVVVLLQKHFTGMSSISTVFLLSGNAVHSQPVCVVKYCRARVCTLFTQINICRAIRCLSHCCCHSLLFQYFLFQKKGGKKKTWKKWSKQQRNLKYWNTTKYHILYLTLVHSKCMNVLSESTLSYHK